MVTDISGGEALRHSKETRSMLNTHIEDCAGYQKDTNESLNRILVGMAESDAVREERTKQHDKKSKSQMKWIALFGLVLTALAAVNIVKDLILN
tara:strand:- start:1366 stop:1647 length:282 start_codon:yes stop_codon:yes gene_type:complete